ncbi:MAG: hypothetical protein AAGC55_19050 [Myxococcota bacterium]
MDQKRFVKACFIASTLMLIAAGCGPGRTAAATQPTPVAFDPAQSDEKSLAAIDEMMTALGGAAAWNQVKQVRWELRYLQNDQLQGLIRHSWDIWNGRHRWEFISTDTYNKWQQEGGDGAPPFTRAMYNLFDREGKGVVLSPLGERAVASERDIFVAEAYRSWQRDSYQLAMFFKLKDPGVKLQYVGERDDLQDYCKSGCLDIKVTFDSAVGNDYYHVYLSKDTKMPVVVERYEEGRSIYLAVTKWVTVNGLQVPAEYKNIGPNQVFQLDKIQIGEPDDELYVMPLGG